ALEVVVIPLVEQVLIDLMHPNESRVRVDDDRCVRFTIPSPRNGTYRWGDLNTTDNDDAWEDWKRGIVYFEPVPVHYVNHLRPLLLPPTYSLRGEELQVVVEMETTYLTPEYSYCSKDEWRTSGTPNDNIVATAIWYYDVENTKISSIGFRDLIRPYDKYFPTRGPIAESVYHYVYNIGGIDRMLGWFFNQAYGFTGIKGGRVVCFPSSYQYTEPEMNLADPSKPGHVKKLYFHFVHPGVRVPSTSIVPPQQQEWWAGTVFSIPPMDSIPVELQTMILKNVDMPMSLKRAYEKYDRERYDKLCADEKAYNYYTWAFVYWRSLQPMLFNIFKYPVIFSSGATLYRTFTLFTSLLAATNMTSSPTVRDRLAEYEPTELRSDLSHLTAGDRQALVKLADVSDLLSSAYYSQLWSGAPALRRELETKAREEAGPETEARDRVRLFELLRGPWDRRRGNQPFIDAVGAKPGGANVYPEDMSKTEFDAWLGTLGTSEEARRARGFYDAVVRRADGRLDLERYADAYAEYLEPAARLMREAADLVSDASFARFLRMRGESFGTNRYLESEVAWLKINSTSALEAAIGPYETYEDELYSAKAFFEAMVHVRDFAGTRTVAKFADSLEYIEARLPIPDAYRNPSLAAPPIVVVNQVYAGGDTAAPMTAAYNLPNDEDAIERAGSKLTLIRNVQEGKVRSVLLPIARAVLDPRDVADVTFDAFFTHVLLHEVAHSNGPHRVVASPDDTVRSRLQDLHSAFEEAKADIAGLFAARLLVASGVIANVTMRQFYTTYLASAFRSVRFGLSEAHGLGQAMQLAYLLDAGGFVYDGAARTFAVDFDAIDGAVADLTRDIMLIQGDGDKARAAAFRDKYGVLAPSVAQALDGLAHVPIDIAPVWADIAELRKSSDA
ncbi:hypothetical protein H4S06_002199, partial [Coemansia sp. BCRC 34490]